MVWLNYLIDLMESVYGLRDAISPSKNVCVQIVWSVVAGL